MALHGIDVSEWQQKIDWQAVHASGQVDFAIIRASANIDYEDKQFIANWTGAKQHGVPRGAYHYADPLGDDEAAVKASARAQAAFFWHMVQSAGGYDPTDIRPVLDIEESNGLPPALVQLWALTWCETIDTLIGRGEQACAIYSDESFYDTYLRGSPALVTRHTRVYVAAYQSSAPAMPYWMWQYSDAGAVPGIVGHVDRDFFPGTLKELIVVPDPTNPAKSGYWLAGSDGGVFALGTALFYGSLPSQHIAPAAPVVAIVGTPDGEGYWLASADGGVYTFGMARFFGSLPGRGIKVSNIVDMIATASGQGYWLVGADGGVFAFGDAEFAGSLPEKNIKVSNVIGIAAKAGK